MNIIEQTIGFVSQYHASDCSGHGVDHIMRVWNTAKMLCVDYLGEVDSEVLQLAALLHDVDDHKINPNGHAAEDYLRSIGLPEAMVQKILSTISPISFSVSGTNPCFDTIEQKLLSDADKLDAMGAIGICRTVAYGASKGRPLYDTETPEESTIQHFYDKLLKLRGCMQTKAGRAEAERRHQYMVDFLRQLSAETGVKL